MAFVDECNKYSYLYNNPNTRNIEAPQSFAASSPARPPNANLRRVNEVGSSDTSNITKPSWYRSLPVDERNKAIRMIVGIMPEGRPEWKKLILGLRGVDAARFGSFLNEASPSMDNGLSSC